MAMVHMWSRRLAGQWIFAIAGMLVGTSEGWCQKTPRYDVGQREEAMVAMRDGIRLATDVYVPAQEGRPVAGQFPVLLCRTPYGRSGTAKAYAALFVPRGYVVVGQDTRGRGGSEGVWSWMRDDRLDGYDAVEWAARQPWSSGKVGMFGESYNGATQHLAAMEQPPHLVAIIPANPSINHGIGGVIYGGAFRLRVWNWVMRNVVNGSRQASDPAVRAVLSEQAEQWQQYLLNLPLRRGMTPLRVAPEYEEMLISMLENRRNDEFWRFNNVIDYVGEHKDIPTLFVGGWYDLFSSSTTETYVALKRAIKAPVHLLMGPWIHGGYKRSHGQVDFGAESVVDRNEVSRVWFDRWLKGTETEFGAQAPFRSPVRLFVMGSGDGHKTDDGLLYHGGYWRDEPDYPLPSALPTKYYLHAGGGLSTEPPAGGVSPSRFEFDPKNPVPTVGGAVVGGSNAMMVVGAWNQWGGGHIWNWPKPIPLSARSDIVVFMSTPLEQDTEIIGPVYVKLWGSSSAVDTDFTAKLIDVYPASADFPSGFDLILGDGIIRARYRESLKVEKLMVPGEVYEFTIKLDPCSNIFKKGHRIRVDISSSNFPRFDVNTNSGEKANDERLKIAAINTFYHDASRPSHIVLPVVRSKRSHQQDVMVTSPKD